MVKLTKEQKAYRKEYYENYKDNFRRYYQKNKDRLRKQHKEWCEKNREKIKEYSKNDREKMKGRSKEWRKGHKTRKKGYNLKKTFGITIKQYNELLKKQRGICAICRNKEDGKALAVDHNHKTGEVRELLCRNCNLAIGLLNESIPILKQSIKYLKKWEIQKETIKTKKWNWSQ